MAGWRGVVWCGVWCGVVWWPSKGGKAGIEQAQVESSICVFFTSGCRRNSRGPLTVITPSPSLPSSSSSESPVPPNTASAPRSFPPGRSLKMRWWSFIGNTRESYTVNQWNPLITHPAD